MEIRRETSGKRSIVDKTIVTWKGEDGLDGIMCMHADHYQEVEGQSGGK